MKVVGYTRTSWAEQVQGSFATIDEQEVALRKFAEKAGVKLDKIHSDAGLSPTQGTCAGMIQILDSMQEGWEAVLVVSLCRLKDIPTLSFDGLQELRENRRMVLVADDATAKALAKRRPKQTARPSVARPDETVRRREIAARLFRGREAGAKAGKHQSGPAPFGYRRDYSRRATDGVRRRRSGGGGRLRLRSARWCKFCTILNNSPRIHKNPYESWIILMDSSRILWNSYKSFQDSEECARILNNS